MSSTPTDVKLEAASQLWSELSARLEAFIGVWESGGEPPTVAEHLVGLTLPLLRMTAIELIKVDLEYRWLKIRAPRPIEDYLAEFRFSATTCRSRW